MERAVTEKEKVEMWFIDPLRRLSGDDGFVCLLICFPLMEAVIRYELHIADDDEFTFSDGSPALKWFAAFMRIPEARAREVWDTLRNGLIHRGMITSTISYILHGEQTDRPSQLTGNVLHMYVWVLRDRVVDLLRKHHKKLWNSASSPLPRISISR